METTSFSLYQTGMQALQQGQLVLAIQHFELAVGDNQQDLNSWLGLALAQDLNGAAKEAYRALDRALTIAPHNMSVLILKGDWLDRDGDERNAAQCYAQVMSIAEQQTDLPGDMQQAVDRIVRRHQQISQGITQHYQNSLRAAGYHPGVSSHRFSQSLALMQGEKTIYFQQPRAYYFPELPQIQFYPPDLLNWAAVFQTKTADIASELEALLRSPQTFEPYLQSDEQGQTGKSNPMLDNPDWSALYFIKQGTVNDELMRTCPSLQAAISQLPQPEIPGRSPMLLLSKLKPGAHIAPHHGFFNTRLVCHLPILVPENCAIRVGNETRQHRKGEILVFDDSIEHEAWNNSAEDRVVLIFDVWRPELSAEERHLVTTLLSAVDQF